MRRITVDTEWTAVPWSASVDLLWVGLADETGRSWCGLNSDAHVDPEYQQYVADLLRLITPEVPRLARAELATAVEAFCGSVDEFWVWVPAPESFATWSRLGELAPQTYQECRDIDLQLLRLLVKPWPRGWPDETRDLNAAAVAAGVPPPERAPNHLHPRVHAEWNQKLLGLIHAAHKSSDA
jgi:hypothetical protein